MDKEEIFFPENGININKLHDENFVLIIDEINRGNMFLYSVHSNLYIIGGENQFFTYRLFNNKLQVRYYDY